MLWLWCRPATVAPTQPLAWELPYAPGVALKKKKKKKKNVSVVSQNIILYHFGSNVLAVAFRENMGGK